MEKEDKEILRLSYENPAKFAEIFNRHHKRFVAIARKRTSSKEEAEDVAQEVFVRIYKYGRKFLDQKDGNFRSWSNVILKNCIIDQVTKKRSKEIRTTEEMESVIGEEKDYYLAESNDFVQSILKRLSSTKAEILRLRFVLGKSFKEIGKILGINSTAARVKTHRAKKEFLEIYTDFNKKML